MSLVQLILLLNLKKYHLFMCWWGWKEMRIHISFIAKWAHHFSSWHNSRFPAFVPFAALLPFGDFVMCCQDTWLGMNCSTDGIPKCLGSPGKLLLQSLTTHVNLVQWLNKKPGHTNPGFLLCFCERLFTVCLPYLVLCGWLLKLGLPLAAEVLTATWLLFFHE